MSEDLTSGPGQPRSASEDLVDVPLDRLTTVVGALVDAVSRRVVGAPGSTARQSASRFQSAL